jgi:hypothetical protein
MTGAGRTGRHEDKHMAQQMYRWEEGRIKDFRNCVKLFHDNFSRTQYRAFLMFSK